MNNAEHLHNVAHGHFTAVSYVVGFGPLVIIILATVILAALNARKGQA